MKRLLVCAACLTVWLGATFVFAQDCKKAEYGPDQKKYMEDAVQKFASCQLPLDDSCRAALAQALAFVYTAKEFGSAPNYMTPTQIAKKVASDSGWEHLGSASDQAALKNAQSTAECGKAVVAVMDSETGGHVALILPGPLAHSGTWKLDVPNSASFFTHNPGKSFAGKPLSYSFPSPEKIELYAKKN
jgi:hypothetical protein